MEDLKRQKRAELKDDGGRSNSRKVSIDVIVIVVADCTIVCVYTFISSSCSGSDYYDP
jgi:hypothetical protein